MRYIYDKTNSFVHMTMTYARSEMKMTFYLISCNTIFIDFFMYKKFTT